MERLCLINGRTILAGIACIMISFAIPETYAPVLLRRRAQRLSRMTSKVYISKFDKGKQSKTLSGMMIVALTRPWALLWFEPIVLLLSLYMALLYGIVGIVILGPVNADSYTVVFIFWSVPDSLSARSRME